MSLEIICVGWAFLCMLHFLPSLVCGGFRLVDLDDIADCGLPWCGLPLFLKLTGPIVPFMMALGKPVGFEI